MHAYFIRRFPHLIGLVSVLLVLIRLCPAGPSSLALTAVRKAHAAPASPGPPAALATDLSTLAEQSGFHRTGRHAELIRLCAVFQQRFPGRARCLRFGTTPEGRPMLALVASADGTVDPAQAQRRGRPVVLFQGGIHAGEIDG